MSDQDGGEAQADAGAQPQAGTDAANGAASGRASEPQDVKELPAWAQKVIRDLRKESGDFRTKLQQFEDAQKSDLDRLIGERDQLRAKAEEAEKALRTERVRSQVRDAAEAAGAHDPGAMWRLIDLDAVEFDAKGTIANLAESLAAVKEAHPRLFRGAGSADGGAGANGGRAGADINAYIRQAAGHRP